LGEPVRLRLLASAEREELSLGELADALGESLPNVSRHATQLRKEGLLNERRLGTRTFVRFAASSLSDAVIEDALGVGRALCEQASVFARINDIVKRRDPRTHELLSLERELPAPRSVADETPLYLAALRRIVPARDLVIDASPGSGALLDVLAPIFRRVVALESPGASRPSRAEQHANLRGYSNVSVIFGDVRAEPVRTELSGAADLVLLTSSAGAERAPITALVSLLKRGGRFICIETDVRGSGAGTEVATSALEHVRVERLEASRILGRADAADWRVFSALRPLG
jgi:DNA-binding transcriptional ArsR family regulator/protein-L-isoaspartate O-methyltransferase